MDTERMMQMVVCSRIIRVVSPRDEDHGKVLSVGAANPAECGESANIEGDDERPCPVHTSVPFGSIGCIQLVTAADLLYMLVPEKLVEQDEIIIARHHEVMLESNLLKPSCYIVSDGV